jgi:hypothetical protein
VRVALGAAASRHDLGVLAAALKTTAQAARIV